MHASVRRYTGVDPRLWEQIQQQRAGLEAAFRRVSGFRAWYLIRTDEGLATVTLCEDQAGAEESVRTAANWIRENMPDLIPSSPQVSNGEVALEIGS